MPAMVMLALTGFLILLILVSLLVLPLHLWLPAEQALQYCRQSIAAMSMLWISLVPLIALCIWAAHHYQMIRRRR